MDILYYYLDLDLYKNSENELQLLHSFIIPIKAQHVFSSSS